MTALRRRIALLAAAGAFVCGCGGGSEEPPAATAEPVAEAASPSPAPVGEDCSTVAGLDGEPRRALPEDVEPLFFSRVYRSEGRNRFYAVLDGEPSEIPSRRDDAWNLLVQNHGWHFSDGDQVEGESALANLYRDDDDRRIEVHVSTLCAGKLVVRYTLR